MRQRQISRFFCLFCIAFFSHSLADHGENSPQKEGEKSPGKGTALHEAGLHNLFCVSENLYSGSQPGGETGFASLKKLGIKTVISVDGARPDIEIAHRFGMRYVHLPIGYDGIPRETLLKLARAARVLPGPIYVHCHHGKHRGPAAVAGILMCNDKSCKASDAIGFMQRAKTDLKYKGLYAVPKEFVAPSEEELQAILPEFPEVSEVEDLIGFMTKIDHEFEVLLPLTMDQEIKDRSPLQQAALLLNEHFRETARLPETANRSPEYREDLQKAVTISADLCKQLESADSGLKNPRQAAIALKGICTHCHERDRDIVVK